MEQAFRHKLDVPFAVEDVFLKIETTRGPLLVFANAYDSGFSSCWPDGSRRLLALIGDRAQTITDEGASDEQWLQRLLKTSGDEFIEDGTPEEVDPLETDVPVCTVTAVLVRPSTVQICFVGGGSLRLVRSGQTVERLKIHTLAEDLRDKGQDVPNELQTILMKYYGKASKDLFHQKWNYTARDELVFAHPEAAATMALTPEQFAKLDKAFACKITVPLP